MMRQVKSWRAARREPAGDAYYRRAHAAPLARVLHQTRRSGFTLVEMLVVMATLSFFLALVISLLFGVISIQRADAALLQRTLDQATLADQFRSDVAQATAAPREVDQFQASPACLILQHPEGAHIVYHWDKSHLRRWLIVDGTRNEQKIPIGGHGADVNLEMAREGDLCVLRLRGGPGAGSTRPRFQLDFEAALGGQRR